MRALSIKAFFFAAMMAVYGAGNLYALDGLAPLKYAYEAMNDDDFKQGESLYLDHCASCHGIKLQGEPNWQTPNPDGTMPAPPHDVSGHSWHHPDDVLFAYTKLGGKGYMKKLGAHDPQSNMPSYDGILSDHQIWRIIHYIKSTWPDDIREMQSEF
ncbi:MAG: cytochrome c [Alphaproteobacteria bacterium]